MNLTDSIAASSDQLDAIDLVSGPRTFEIEKVSANNADQPFNFHLKGFPKVWRPGKSMRRVIVAAWGPLAEKYVGQSVTLYCDPTVKFGPEVTGGTRISHMTGIDKPLKVSLMVSRGKFTQFTVQPLKIDAPVSKPLTDTSGRQWLQELEMAGDDLDLLLALGVAASREHAPDNHIAAIRAKWSEVKEAKA